MGEESKLRESLNWALMELEASSPHMFEPSELRGPCTQEKQLGMCWYHKSLRLAVERARHQPTAATFRK